MAVPGVIFDRDGTLIDFVRDEESGAVFTAFHPSHLRVLPGAFEGLRLLVRSGFTLAIATNQPGVAKGHFSREAIARTHDALLQRFKDEGVEFAAVEACLHHPVENPDGDRSLQVACDCRKPLPGMLHRIVSRLGFDRTRTWMVGDALSDLLAGEAAGLHSALVRPDRRCEACPLSDTMTSVATGSILELCRRIAQTQTVSS